MIARVAPLALMLLLAGCGLRPLYGVLVGPTIRDGWEHTPAAQGHRFYAFAAQMLNEEAVDRADAEAAAAARGLVSPGEETWDLLERRLGLRTVPRHGDGLVLGEMADDHEELLALARSDVAPSHDGTLDRVDPVAPVGIF